MISLRPMQDRPDDYLAMQRWFAEPELQEWVWCDEKGEGEVPLSRIIEKYGARIKHPVDVFPYFILSDGIPMGFIQYYFADPDTIGLDMWIGTAADRGRGYGVEALRQMVALIREKHPQIRELFIDPAEENARAIRCYEKAGFRHCGKIFDDGGLCLLMKYPLLSK